MAKENSSPEKNELHPSDYVTISYQEFSEFKDDQGRTIYKVKHNSYPEAPDGVSTEFMISSENIYKIDEENGNIILNRKKEGSTGFLAMTFPREDGSQGHETSVRFFYGEQKKPRIGRIFDASVFK